MRKRCVVVILATNDSHQGMLESLLIGHFGIACYVVPCHKATPNTLNPFFDLGIDAIIVDAPLMNDVRCACQTHPTKTIVIPSAAYESPTLLLDELQPGMHDMLGAFYPQAVDASHRRYS